MTALPPDLIENEMDTTLELELELSDAGWRRVHDAVKAFDPVRYDECGTEMDHLLQCLFEIIGEETRRGYKTARQSRKQERA